MFLRISFCPIQTEWQNNMPTVAEATPVFRTCHGTWGSSPTQGLFVFRLHLLHSQLKVVFPMKKSVDYQKGRTILSVCGLHCRLHTTWWIKLTEVKGQRVGMHPCRQQFYIFLRISHNNSLPCINTESIGWHYQWNWSNYRYRTLPLKVEQLSFKCLWVIHEMDHTLDHKISILKFQEVGNLTNSVILSQDVNYKPRVGIHQETASSLKINTRFIITPALKGGGQKDKEGKL